MVVLLVLVAAPAGDLDSTERVDRQLGVRGPGPRSPATIRVRSTDQRRVCHKIRTDSTLFHHQPFQMLGRASDTTADSEHSSKSGGDRFALTFCGLATKPHHLATVRAFPSYFWLTMDDCRLLVGP